MRWYGVNVRGRSRDQARPGVRRILAITCATIEFKTQIADQLNRCKYRSRQETGVVLVLCFEPSGLFIGGPPASVQPLMVATNKIDLFSDCIWPTIDTQR